MCFSDRTVFLLAVCTGEVSVRRIHVQKVFFDSQKGNSSNQKKKRKAELCFERQSWLALIGHIGIAFSGKKEAEKSRFLCPLLI